MVKLISVNEVHGKLNQIKWKLIIVYQFRLIIPLKPNLSKNKHSYPPQAYYSINVFHFYLSPRIAKNHEVKIMVDSNYPYTKYCDKEVMHYPYTRKIAQIYSFLYFRIKVKQRRDASRISMYCVIDNAANLKIKFSDINLIK